MLSRLRYWCHRSRALLFALLVLTFLWHPALIAASEAHESEHRVSTGFAHAADHDAHDDGHHTHADDPLRGIDGANGSDPGQGDDNTPWHDLLHMGHCCGHAQAMPTDWLISPADAATEAGTVDHVFNLPSPALGDPLRPPILG